MKLLFTHIALVVLLAFCTKNTDTPSCYDQYPNVKMYDSTYRYSVGDSVKSNGKVFVALNIGINKTIVGIRPESFINDPSQPLIKEDYWTSICK